MTIRDTATGFQEELTERLATFRSTNEFLMSCIKESRRYIFICNEASICPG